MTMTITEALAECKTIPKRIAKHRDAIMRYLYRDSRMVDPLLDEQGHNSRQFIEAQQQAIRDLQHRLVSIRCEIQKANQTNTILVADRLFTVAYWLNWRREIMEGSGQMLGRMASTIEQVRQQAAAAKDGAGVVINIDEAALADSITEHERIMGELDGKLSLVNATTSITLV